MTWLRQWLNDERDSTTYYVAVPNDVQSGAELIEVNIILMARRVLNDVFDATLIVPLQKLH